MSSTNWPARELYATEELGIAYSKVPPGYTGPVLLQLDYKESRTVCFPCEEEGNRAAAMAVGPLGGYNSALVSPAPPHQRKEQRRDIVAHRATDDRVARPQHDDDDEAR